MSKYAVVRKDAKTGKPVATMAANLEAAHELQAKYSKGKSKNKATIVPVVEASKPKPKKAK